MKKDDVHYREKLLPVMEIFGPTIQGEGYLAGAQTMFIRFGGCDYKCRLCDSIHAIDPDYIHNHAEWITQETIANRIAYSLGSHAPWITLSGGNPAIHELGHLVLKLKELDYKVAIETQGTLAPDWINELDCITVSPKSPGMGEKFEPEAFGRFLERYQGNSGLNVKVVVFDEADLEFAAQISGKFVEPFNLEERFYLSLGNPSVPVLMANGELLTRTSIGADHHRLVLLTRYAKLADLITSDPRLCDARFFPQLHVLAWSNERGR